VPPNFMTILISGFGLPASGSGRGPYSIRAVSALE
jgi:hypothetical protein